MALSQSFLLRVAKIDGNKQLLTRFLSELDEQKDSARSTLLNFSDSPEAVGLSEHARIRKLRQLRAKIDRLKVEREYVANKIAELKSQKRISNNSSAKFQAAFMAAAEKVLDEKTYLNIESKAAMLITTQQL